jgi:hypothetical protein
VNAFVFCSGTLSLFIKLRVINIVENNGNDGKAVGKLTYG